MESISKTLKKKKIVVNTKPRRKGNPLYGLALDLQMKLDLALPMCFRLLKKHSPEELGRLVTWWKDYPFKKENNIGLLYWKLKQMYPEKYAKK